jgi:hypothetical protein
MIIRSPNDERRWFELGPDPMKILRVRARSNLRNPDLAEKSDLDKSAGRRKHQSDDQSQNLKIITQRALLNGITDNFISQIISLGSFSKSRFLKLASFNWNGSLNNAIIRLLLSEIARPK